MRRLKIAPLIFVVALCTIFRAHAQDTNLSTALPATEFENFQLQTNTIIVRGFSLIGAVSLENTTISVHAQEGNDISHNQKLYGVTIGIGGVPQEGTRGNFTLMVDYDELDSLTGSIEYISKVTWGVTQLNGFEATYATKSGLRFIAHSDRRQGAINTFIQFGDGPKIPMNSDQLNQLRTLIVQAKNTLDGLK